MPVNALTNDYAIEVRVRAGACQDPGEVRLPVRLAGGRMTLQGMAWNSGQVWSWSVSVEINFAPTTAVVQCSLSQAWVNACGIGIYQYFTRTQPNGPDQAHDLPVVWDEWPPVVYDNAITSVAAFLGASQVDNTIATGTLMASLWS